MALTANALLPLSVALVLALSLLRRPDTPSALMGPLAALAVAACALPPLCRYMAQSESLLVDGALCLAVSALTHQSWASRARLLCFSLAAGCSSSQPCTDFHWQRASRGGSGSEVQGTHLQDSRRC